MADKEIPWLDDEHYKKRIWFLRRNIEELLYEALGMKEHDQYGLKVYIPGAVEEIVKLAEDFGLIVRGIDKPLNKDWIRRRK